MQKESDTVHIKAYNGDYLFIYLLTFIYLLFK